METHGFLQYAIARKPFLSRSISSTLTGARLIGPCTGALEELGEAERTEREDFWP
jgi:hypothetical protein